MTLLWLPGAIRDQHGSHPFPWAETTNPKGCLHTTEGWSWPTYDGWTIMPHATVMATPNKGVTVRQHLPFSQASFALRHTRAQPTNGDYIFQFELIGTCDPNGPGYYWPAADSAVLKDLYLKVIKPLGDAFAIPLKALAWDAYPSQTGAHRLTDAQFDSYQGWLGHQHVPQNDHGDPGAFPWARLVAIANTIANTEDDMPSLDEIGKLIDAKLAAERANIVTALLTADLGRSGPNVGVALQSGFVAAKEAAATAQQILSKVDAASRPSA